MLADQLLGQGQPHAGPVGLGGEVRLEQAGLDLRRDPGPESATSSSSSPSAGRGAQDQLPRLGIACIALITRFSIAWVNFSASSGTRGRAASEYRHLDLDPRCPAWGPISRTISLRTPFTSAGRTSGEQTGEVVETLKHAVEPEDLGFQNSDQFIHRPAGARVAQALVE